MWNALRWVAESHLKKLALVSITSWSFAIKIPQGSSAPCQPGSGATTTSISLYRNIVAMFCDLGCKGQDWQSQMLQSPMHSSSPLDVQVSGQKQRLKGKLWRFTLKHVGEDMLDTRSWLDMSEGEKNLFLWACSVNSSERLLKVRRTNM